MYQEKVFIDGGYWAAATRMQSIQVQTGGRRQTMYRTRCVSSCALALGGAATSSADERRTTDISLNSRRQLTLEAPGNVAAATP
ncbi:MAG: hypothetical protein H7Z40_22830 [Phycisphaerae bacterium]|nr:hypothetical protein [Gemmatimonadaceae bacterium]